MGVLTIGFIRLRDDELPMLDEIENPIQYIIHVIDYILDLKEFITEGFVMQST